MSLPDGTVELLQQLDEQAPIVPDELTQYILRKCGQDCKDPKLVRVVSLASQRFIAEVIHDTLQLCKTRLSTAGRKVLKAQGFKEKRVLTTEDLAKALKELGVTLRTPPYYVDAKEGADS